MKNKDLDHLSEYSRRWAEGVLTDYEIEDAQRPLVVLAAQTLDKIAEAERIINEDGAFFTDKAGKPRKHPALDCQRNDKIAFARLCRELALSDEPTEARPPRI
ncbi:MAG: hypothetical protein QMD09_14195 [Desulfatibacillaceae bacterium]|nr:hypothetical protein [Desulfatibacillaceae bacterium]